MILFPLSAALLSLLCAAIAARRYAARRRPHELAWGIAFGLFALAASVEVAGDSAGWTPFLVRLYYASGVVLTTAFLGLGSLALLLGRRLERWGPGLMLALAALGVAFVFNTPVDEARLDQGWQALQRRGTPTYLLTTLSNAGGAAVVIGGALYSVAVGRRRGMPRERMAGLLAIALGTLLIASGGIVARRLGNDDFLYTTMTPGIAIILLGYLGANRALPKCLPARPAGAAVAAPARGAPLLGCPRNLPAGGRAPLPRR
jgi:peptidoglycan/LPS O-acetylase OafA/YrhL